ncbi:MAG: hypothetical protein COB46_09610 [Rhodospirillaceae bacterium]|nr:MAG: hypothetical protein COB46_09610 [Rhodospirillaceae bacterium]
MSTKNFAILAIVLWVASAAFLGFKFITGETIKAEDGREAIVLTSAERVFILDEMRNMLEAVQEIISAVNEDDMDAVRKIAHDAGMAEARKVPVATMLKLPLGFKQLGGATHKGFDEIGLAADMGGELVMERLEENLGNCVGCHKIFQLVAKD